jgi:hypothetical protein
VRLEFERYYRFPEAFLVVSWVTNERFAARNGAQKRQDINYVLILSRQHGVSKLDTMVLWQFFLLLLDKSFGRYSGPIYQLSADRRQWRNFAHFRIDADVQNRQHRFFVAQIAAIFTAIITNFLLNNALTYRDQRA